MKELHIDEFLNLQEQGAEILDTRGVDDFKKGFVPSSINIPFKHIKDWAVDILNIDDRILLVTEPGKESESVAVLNDRGFTNVEGYLKGGFETWQKAGKEIDLIIDVEADELVMDIPFDDKLIVVDVRKPMEYAEGHLKDAVNLPLPAITDPLRIAQFEENENLYLHCGGGTRSVIAASILKKHGIHNLRNIAGGWKKIKEEPKAKIVKEPHVLN